MCKLLDNVNDERHAGLHLIYSQFRTMEGIEIIKMILEANGYAEFKLVKQGGDWIIKEDDADDEGKPGQRGEAAFRRCHQPDASARASASTWAAGVSQLTTSRASPEPASPQS